METNPYEIGGIIMLVGIVLMSYWRYLKSDD